MGYTVYRLTSPSGKVYIGITSKPVKRRWNNGWGYKRCPAMNNAIRKYGWENIKKEVLLEGTTENEAKELETLLIKLHRSNESKYGYNLTEGGDGTKGHYPSEETRKKMGEAHKGNKYNLGRKLSEEQKRLISERQRGADNQRAKRVICLETLKVYDTMTQAAKETGATKITDCCRHYYKHKSSAGLHWEYYDDRLSDDDYREILQRLLKEEYENKHHKPSEENKRKNIERSSISIICVETGTIFNSIHAACREYNLSPSNVCNCCKGKKKTTGGFHWKYATGEVI
jgi:group I intron endonuclease